MFCAHLAQEIVSEHFAWLPVHLRQNQNVVKTIYIACSKRGEQCARKNFALDQLRQVEDHLGRLRQTVAEEEMALREVDASIRAMIDLILRVPPPMPGAPAASVPPSLYSRNDEGSSFTGTGFCNTNDIAVLETDGNGLPLNGRRLFVADRLNAL